MTHVMLEQAVRALQAGRLVGLPTETVYGLGADAENTEAVARIFEAKGRPRSHPLIVHIASERDLPAWSPNPPARARQLARAFWPGPLTLVVPRGSRAPLVTTGGLETVALRVPAHPLALELLTLFAGGVAAPSANRFGKVSPTRAEHVRADLGDWVDVVLDGGPCEVGLESTIVDVSGDGAVLLRPGRVTVEDMERVLGEPVSRQVAAGVRAPGLLASHYAPDARVELAEASKIAARAGELCAQGARVGLLVSSAECEALATSVRGEVQWLALGPTEAEAAQHLYGCLRRADELRLDVVLASPPLVRGLGEALADRLNKASAPRHPLG